MGCNFNEHIKKQLLNEYGGSEKKRTIILDDGNKYLLKFPDPIREKDRLVSYINNAISEYIGCKIAKSIGLPVQEVILGEFTEKNKTKIACACKDVRNLGETMHEINRLELESLDASGKTDFNGINEIISRLENVNKNEIKDFYYDMFILDALIGNTDRHNGNWALLSNENGDIRICPIYDCGSSLSPLLHDKELANVNIQNTALSVYSVILDENGKRINYYDYLMNGNNKDVNEALKRVFPHINIPEISKIIDETPYISEERKDFYKNLIIIRYEKELIPAFMNVIQKEIPLISHDNTKYNYYDFFQKNIRQIQNLPEHQKSTVIINGIHQDVIKISSRHALCYGNSDKIAVISIRSNNNEIAQTIRTLQYLGHLLLDNYIE